MPHQYRYLSSRLVTQRGIVLMGAAAVGMLVTKGSVALLVVLYSINVFLTFSLSLLGLSTGGACGAPIAAGSAYRLSGFGLAVTASIQRPSRSTEAAS